MMEEPSPSRSQKGSSKKSKDPSAGVVSSSSSSSSLLSDPVTNSRPKQNQKEGGNQKEKQQQQQQQKQNSVQKNETKEKYEKRQSQTTSHSQQSNQHQQQGHSTANRSNQQQAKPAGTPVTTVVKDSRLALLDHLPRKVSIPYSNSVEGDKALHPATIKLGCMFRQGIIREDDDRVAALLAMFCNVIEDYKTPTNKSLNRDLDKHISAQVQHLVNCRQISMGMGNLIKYLKLAISRVRHDISESEAKSTLISQLHSFLEERILFSREMITQICSDTIRNGDVILTFGSSPLLTQVFISAAAIKKFKLIIVDTRPLNDGLKMLEALSPFVPCVYTLLGGAVTVLQDATKVFLGASGLLSNGAMLAPAGTAMISSLAQRRQVPVIVACEGYKFCEKVQVDSIVYNELGSPGEIASAIPPSETIDGIASAIPQQDIGYRGAAGIITPSNSSIKGEEVDTNAAQLPFQVVNLRYDLTPIRNISAIATETGLIPPTSIPVLLREFRADASIAGTSIE